MKRLFFILFIIQLNAQSKISQTVKEAIAD